jgi:RNA polymerase sigma-70 factor, ECF subfamily
MGLVGDGRAQHDVTTRDGLMAFYDLAFCEVYRSAATLTRGDRPAAEDLVQDAFVRLARSARAGDVTAVGVGWLVTTVRRLHIDRLRSNDRETRRLQLVAVPTGSQEATNAVSAASVLDGLSERERAALVLRYVEDLAVGEVADLMGSTVRAIESLLQRAKRKARASRRIS